MTMDILDIIRQFLTDIGFTAVAGLSDFVLGAGILVLAFLALRITIRIVSAIVKLALSLGLLLLIIVVLMAMFT